MNAKRNFDCLLQIKNMIYFSTSSQLIKNTKDFLSIKYYFFFHKLLGKKRVFYGWGITDDRVQCERRDKVRSVEEVFAAAYILYTRYHNPYTKSPSDILDTIFEIVKQRKGQRFTFN